MGWVCEGCGQRSERDDLTFAMMHEDEGHHVVPDTGTALRWGKALGGM